MQLTSMTLKDGRMELNGYPEGATVRGLALPQAAELCRLMLFRGDLTYVVDCIEAANKMEVGSEKRQEHLQREALCSSALIRFFCCFEGTSGLRSKPLRRKSIFSGDDRKAFERLGQIRNQAVAHNEHLYPGEFPLIVQDADGAAIEAVVLRGCKEIAESVGVAGQIGDSLVTAPLRSVVG